LFLESQPLSLGVIAIVMKWLRKVPYIYNVPDLQVDVAEQMGFMRSKAFLKLAFRAENFFLRHSWKVSTVTNGFVEHLRARGLAREQVTFLPNGADSSFLRPLPPSQRLLDRWRLRGKKVFLYVGTHAYYHGLETLIDAAKLLREDCDIVFVMIGGGPERQRLKTICEGGSIRNVIFADSPYEEMDQLYSIAWASIATLRNIEVARNMRLSKIFPSLSCGVPVIYSGAGEAAELIRATKSGLVAEPENPRLLAEAVEILASQPEMRREMGERGRALVERDYSWSAIVQRWLGDIGL
jgi:glycosyltransferase involved in cell wall biosynthesis